MDKRHKEKLMKTNVETEDISYIMQEIKPHLESILTALNIQFLKKRGKYIIGWCPDHHIYTGRNPSHPKWYLNVDTGQTHCKTEMRGSNLLYVIKRICDCSIEEAFNILTQGLDKAPNYIKYKIKKRKDINYNETEQEEQDPSRNETLQSMIPMIVDAYIGKRAKEFFEKDGITLDTVRDFYIIEINKGKYKDRVIIPFMNDESGDACGFVAINMYKKREWVRLKIERFKKYNEIENFGKLLSLYRRYCDYYKKALFCPGLSTGNHLFGLRKLIEEKKLKKTIFLVEGERDCVKLQQEGFPCVATHGAHLSDEQLLLLKKYGIEKVYILFDGDEAGYREAEKVFSNISGVFNEVYNVVLPKGKDPKHYKRQELLELIGSFENKKRQKRTWIINEDKINWRKKRS